MLTGVLLATVLVTVDSATVPPSPVQSNCRLNNDALLETEVVYAFVIFRHGDRTPRREEILVAPEEFRNISLDPYGHESLTNRGKLREYELGKQLRCRYDGLVDSTYVPGQAVMNVTLTDRTKMSAALVLAGLYPPTEQQTWLPGLVWQPIPYYEHPVEGTDFFQCPRHRELMSELLETPKYKKILEDRQTFTELSQKTSYPVESISDVRNLREAIRGLNNVGVEYPDWFVRLSDQIDRITKMALLSHFDTVEMAKLSGGIYVHKFMEESSKIVAGKEAKPRLQLLSAHEIVVASFMAAAGVFQPHIPKYGASFGLELRRNTKTGIYFVSAVSTESPESEPRLLPQPQCDDAADATKSLCDYSAFQRLTDSVRISPPDVMVACQQTVN